MNYKTRLEQLEQRAAPQPPFEVWWELLDHPGRFTAKADQTDLADTVSGDELTSRARAGARIIRVIYVDMPGVTGEGDGNELS